MKMKKILFVMAILLLTVATPQIALSADASRPQSPVKLVFIHHSTGGNWLADPGTNSLGGGLGLALMNNNYYASATNYGWGPDTIGDRTDIVNWTEWFSSANSATILNALYTETGQNIGDYGSWPRLSTDPGGENTIVMFKSCFPNSNLYGNPDDPAELVPNEDLTVGNAKAVYNNLLGYFQTRQDKLFVVITAPPLALFETNAEHLTNARAFNNWLVNDWLKTYPYQNVAVFDFYNVLTSNGGNTNTNDVGQEYGNHHRWENGQVRHIQTENNNSTSYPSDDSHPNSAGGQKATAEFIPLLNYYYNNWKENTIPGANCIVTDNELNLQVYAKYRNSAYGLLLKYSPVSFDLSGLYWKADLSTFSQIQTAPAASIFVADDLRLNLCAKYGGLDYDFTLDFIPVSDDPSGLYWKMDTNTIRLKR